MLKSKFYANTWMWFVFEKMHQLWKEQNNLKKLLFWLIKSIQLRKEIFIYKKINNEIKEIIFNEATNSINKKKEYYDFAIMAKSVEKFKWN